MKSLLLKVVMGVMCASASLPLFPQASGPVDLAGSWLGELKAGAVTLRIVFNITRSGGTLSATMDSPDQGVKGIPVSKVDVNGDKVLFEVKATTGSYAGTVSPDGKTIGGAWAQAGQSFPVVLRRLESAFTLERPQEPKPPLPYASLDVTFTSPKAGVELAGTLTVPTGTGPFPAVVLVTGSGPQNRDEELLGHKPFLIISDYLTRNGIVVLRYDDRGVARSKGSFATATTLDFADDAEAALAFLSFRPEVDRRRIGIAGHSEGGLIAPIVASRNPAVAFIILLAGPGISGDRLLLLQAAAIAHASGADEKTISAMNTLNEKLYEIAERETDPARIVAEGKKTALALLDADTSMSDRDRTDAKKNIDRAMMEISNPWFRTFLTLDPAAFLSKVRIPVLALNGSKDLQVPADANISGIESALKAAGNTNYRVLKLEGLNHLFQHADTGLPSEYGKLTETFAPEALSAMKDFILGLR
jgi:pimeloyl-ACP methyl ester carboxylesterase